MALSTLLIATIALTLLITAYRRDGHGHRDALDYALKQGARNLPRILFAIMSAGFIGALLPQEAVGAVLGAETGLWGILLASVLGCLIPGGPMLAFPIAVALLTAGSGMPQVVALLSGWSIFTINRFVIWELPVMGGSYAARRMLASMFLPPLAGLMVAGLDRIGWV